MTTRPELIAALRDRLRTAAELGHAAESDEALAILADYVIALAAQVKAGTVVFEGQGPPTPRPDFAAAIAELELRRPPAETTIERPKGDGTTDVMNWRVTV